MLKSHSGAAASSISHVDVYVYPVYDTEVNAAAYVTNVKSRFNTVDNPIGLDIECVIRQSSEIACTNVLQGDSFTISLPQGAGVFNPYQATPVSADPSVASLKMYSIQIGDKFITTNPGEFITGSYVYRIFGWGECQGL